MMIALRIATSRKKPRVPAGVRIYAVGDIHGRVDLLDVVLKRIDADLEQNPISVPIEVYLGDYIDRGPCFAGGNRSTGGAGPNISGSFSQRQP